MPAVNSSRHRSRREPSEQIEEEELSQHSDQVDDVDEEEEEEEEQPRRRSKKTGKGATKNKKSRQDGEEVQADDDDDDPIDVENFPDHAVDKKEAQRMVGIVHDWDGFRESVLKNSYTLVQDLGEAAAEVAEGERGEKVLGELDRIMKESIDVEQELIVNAKTISDIHQIIAQDIEVKDLVERYEKEVKKRMNDYRDKTTRQKYAKNDQYSRFKDRIWGVQNPGQGMPPVTEFIPKEPGDVSDDDDDLEVGGVTQDFKCPLTLTILVEPVTSEVCGHSFSGKAIRDYIQATRGQKKCPAAGCNQFLSVSDLKPDKTLAKRVKAIVRRQQRQEEDSDDDEVIE